MSKKVRRAKKWLKGYRKAEVKGYNREYGKFCKRKLFENCMQNYFYADPLEAQIQAMIMEWNKEIYLRKRLYYDK